MKKRKLIITITVTIAFMATARFLVFREIPYGYSYTVKNKKCGISYSLESRIPLYSIIWYPLRILSIPPDVVRRKVVELTLSPNDPKIAPLVKAYEKKSYYNRQGIKIIYGYPQNIFFVNEDDFVSSK